MKKESFDSKKFDHDWVHIKVLAKKHNLKDILKVIEKKEKIWRSLK